jgi:hypothetical protein
MKGKNGAGILRGGEVGLVLSETDGKICAGKAVACTISSTETNAV